MSIIAVTGINPSPLLAQMHGNKIDLKDIDAYIAEKMRLPSIPGLALAIVKDDQIVYLKGYGQSDPSGNPVTPQTSFIIGSVTKVFTALAMVQLVEAGQVQTVLSIKKSVQV